MLLFGLLNAPSAQVRHVCDHHRFTTFHANQRFGQGSAYHQATVLRMLAIITHTSSSLLCRWLTCCVPNCSWCQASGVGNPQAPIKPCAS